MKGPVPRVNDGMCFLEACESSEQNPLPVGSQKWFSLVADVKKFVFTFPDLPGHFKALREPHCGKWYWFAYRGRQGKICRTYIGKPTELTTERLYTSARQLLHESETGPRRPAPKVMTPTLRTKLVVPPVHTGEIVHTAAFEHLRQFAEVPLTTVVAPAGYGKTTLLADWATTLESPVAWLTLDSDDNLPGCFWSYIRSALEPLVPGLSSLTFPRARSPELRPEQEEFTALINLLITAAKLIVLVLDNYQQVRRDAQIHDDLAFLIDHLPANAHIILASRTEPPLPLPHLRAHGQLNEIHVNDLGLTPAEAAQLLANAHITLTKADRDALYTHIGDWITGWKFAVDSLKRSAKPHDWVADFNGGQRYINDYFNDEVLKAVPPEMLTFLLHTSILPQFTAPLCDAVTGLTSSRQILDALQQADLFIEVVDARQQRYRYQPLFAETLRHQLAQRSPERIAELHRRASAWHAQHGETDLAIEHAAQAGDYDQAAQMIAEMSEQVIARSDLKMVEQWLALLPCQIVHQYPRVSFLKAYDGVLQGRLAEVEHDLQAAEAAGRSGADGMAPDHPLFQGEVLAIRATLAAQQGRPHKALALCRQALSAMPAQHALRSLLSLDASIAYSLLGEANKAAPRLEAHRRQSELLHNRSYMELSTIALERACLLEGRLSEALELCRQLETESNRRECLIDMARIAYERDELDVAATYLSHALDDGRTVRVAVMGYTLLANVQRARGDLEEAAHLIGQALTLSGDHDGDLLVLARTFQARLALARGDIDTASHWARAYEQLPARDIDEDIAVAATFTRAQICMARHTPHDALHLLTPIRAEAERTGRQSHVIAVLALQALAQETLGERQAADESLRRALSLGEPEGFVRTFVDCGPLLAPLLERLHKSVKREKRTPQGASPGYLARVLQAFAHDDEQEVRFQRRTGTPPAPRAQGMPQQQPLIEPLSTREIEVLGLLSQGLSNIELSQELVIAVGTVKRHLSNIFLKLNVQSRTQAIARARALHLIE